MASKATVTSVSDTNASTQLIGANPKRTGLFVRNTSSAILYLRLGTGTADATTGGSLRLAAGGSAGDQIDLSNFGGRAFKGAVQGIWASDSTGAAVITELE